MQESYYPTTRYHKKILLCGPIPPPLGGVAVHVQRVTVLLKKQHNEIYLFDATHYKNPLRRWLVFLQTIIVHRPDELHYHTLYHNSIEWLLVIIGKWFINYTLLLIDHDCRDLYKRSRWTKYLFNTTMRYVDQQVIMGTKVQESYYANNIALAKKNSLDTPFLSPDLAQERAILADYPPELFIFIEQHKPLIAVNAFRLVLLDSKDLYGIDQALCLLLTLRTHYDSAGLIIALATRGDEQYFAELQRYIIKNDLINAVFFLEGQQQLWPLLKKVDLFIRPTLSDNYGISIAEALYCQTPALASNVCERPAGTYLYQTGNVDHLTQQAYFILKKGKAHGTSDHQYNYLHPQ